MVNGEEKGRPLGLNLLYQLAHRTGEFRNFSYKLHVAAIIGAPIFREVLVYFRDALNDPNLKLEEAAELSYLSGLIRKTQEEQSGIARVELPKEEYINSFTKKDWNRLRNGASVEQIELIEDVMMQSSLAKSHLLHFPRPELFPYAYPQELSSLFDNPTSQEDAYKRWAISSALTNYLLFDRDQLGMNPTQVFFGYHDPIIVFPDPAGLITKLNEIKESKRRAT